MGTVHRKKKKYQPLKFMREGSNLERNLRIYCDTVFTHQTVRHLITDQAGKQDCHILQREV